MQLKFHNNYDALRTAVIGNVYDDLFFSAVADSKLRDSLTRILSETREDLVNFKSTLQGLGVTVLQPAINPKLSINDYAVNGNVNKAISGSNNLIPRPPLQVRDSFFVLDDTLYQTRYDGIFIQKFLSDHFGKDGELDFKHPFDAPSITILNEKIFVDVVNTPGLDNTIRGMFANKTVIPVEVGGHTDAVFSIIKPGVLITTEDPTLYKETFPGWDVLSLPNQSWKAVAEFRKIKNQNGGKWWAPEIQQNVEMSNFVETWLSEWYGFAEETVFDVNCLVVSQELVIVNGYNKEMHEFFKKHNIEYIIVPFRHRFFWDGGLHCITNDIERSSS